MKRRSPRGLDPEEQSLWERVAQTTTPLEKRPATSSAGPTITKTEEDPAPRSPVSAGFRVGSNAQTALVRTDLAPGPIERVRAQPLLMDKKAFKKLQRGQSRPDARLDLHGMTAAEAHDALVGFVLSAHASGKRLVLVITGKGRSAEDSGPIPTRMGVLRRQVPIWLSQAPLAPIVLQTSHAHQRHGGSGALYVYLRRR